MLPKPSLLAPVIWDEPATVSEVANLVSTVVALFQPKSDDVQAEAAHVSLLVTLVAARGYKRAEVAHAMHEMPYDEEMNAKLRYRAPVTPADFEACINRVREHRAWLKTTMTQQELNEFLRAHPEFDKSHFGVRHDAKNNPIYLWLDPDKRRT